MRKWNNGVMKRNDEEEWKIMNNENEGVMKNNKINNNDDNRNEMKVMKQYQ